MVRPKQVKQTRIMFSQDCEVCGKKIYGSKESQTIYLLAQHKLAKH